MGHWPLVELGNDKFISREISAVLSQVMWLVKWELNLAETNLNQKIKKTFKCHVQILSLINSIKQSEIISLIN